MIFPILHDRATLTGNQDLPLPSMNLNIFAYLSISRSDE
jgi:hypothetical protein